MTSATSKATKPSKPPATSALQPFRYSLQVGHTANEALERESLRLGISVTELLRRLIDKWRSDLGV